jgi:hypothetical protein
VELEALSACYTQHKSDNFGALDSRWDGAVMQSFLRPVHSALFVDRVNRVKTAFYSACQPFRDEIEATEEQARAFNG